MTFLETITSSAALGHPRSPRRIDMSPSFMTAPSVMDWSWQWSMTGRSNIFAYSIARRMRSLDWTQSPSSVIATTPARFREPMGDSVSPFIPIVIVPVGSTLTTASRRTASWMNWMVPALSAGGVVFGMQTTVVKPPAAAALEPVNIVSLWVWPGSRKWTWMSTRPGDATSPRASIFLALFRLAAGRRATNLPSSAKRSPTESRFAAGSMTRAFLIQRAGMVAWLLRGGDDVLGLVARAEVEDRHPHGDAVGDLLQDDAALAVRQLAVDLDAAVYGPRVHDDRVG